MRVKVGATKDGTIAAAEAYPRLRGRRLPGSPVGAGAHVHVRPYEMANVRIDGYDVGVNKPKTPPTARRAHRRRPSPRSRWWTSWPRSSASTRWSSA